MKDENDWIKQNLLELAKEHKITARKNSNVNLQAVKLAIEKLGKKLTEEEKTILS